MPLGLIGVKVGMTQVYEADGSVEPVTVLQVGPCPVLQIRTPERDGYSAVQLGFQDKPRKNAKRPEQGHVASELKSKRKEGRLKAGVQLLPKANCEPQRFIREFRVDQPTAKVGDVLKLTDVFPDSVKSVDVVGTSKGRGYQGVMKRHGFAGMPAAHGSKKNHRQAGSTSSLASNRGTGRPKKGRKLPGQFGNVRVTNRNLKVVRIDAENNLILIRGSVPGPNGGTVMITPTNKFGSTHGVVRDNTPAKTKMVLQKKGK